MSDSDEPVVPMIILFTFIIAAGVGLGMWMLDKDKNNIMINDVGIAIPKQKIGSSSLYSGNFFGAQCRIISSSRQTSADCNWSTATPFKTIYLSDEINHKGLRIKRMIMNNAHCIVVKGRNSSDINCSSPIKANEHLG
jgi:hypothetical protein